MMSNVGCMMGYKKEGKPVLARARSSATSSFPPARAASG
jgi:hypothetical protein